MNIYELPREVLLKAIELLAQDRLETVNKLHGPVVPADNFYVRYGKRILDILISLPLFLLTLPINLVIGVVTFFDVGSPLFFTQERLGKDQKPFTIIKFRNMRNTRNERGDLLPPAQRVTKWGRFVRKTSMDELLNFYSVLKGDMSIIGPRPLVVTYAGRFSQRHAARFAVKPGLECPPRAGHGKLRGWQDQFENDVWYVENVSFKTDLLMCWNLIRFTFDFKNAATRSVARRGSFVGYSLEGNIIDIDDVPEEYFHRAIAEIERKRNKTA